MARGEIGIVFMIICLVTNTEGLGLSRILVHKGGRGEVERIR